MAGRSKTNARARMLREMKAWALSRRGMDDPQTRGMLMAMSEAADERLSALRAGAARSATPVLWYDKE